MINDQQILEDSIFKVGKVIAVDGRMISVKVDKTKNTSNLLYKGELLKNVSVGGYIKIVKGFTRIVGKVEGEYIQEDKSFAQKEYRSDKQKIDRTLKVSLLGFFKANNFERGIKELPLIDNECYLLNKDEFNQVHNFISDNDEPLHIGTLALEKGQEINIGINSLFASHIGIFGNTGSGKSYTLAKIYWELFKKYKSNKNFKINANFFLIDFSGEYIKTISQDHTEHFDVIVEKEFKNIYELSTGRKGSKSKFPINKSTLNDTEFWSVFLEATEKTQSPFISRSLNDSSISNEDLNATLKTKINVIIDEVIKKKDKNLGSKIFFDLFSDLVPSITEETKIQEINSHLKKTLGFNGTTGSYYVAGFSGTTNGQYSEENVEKHIITPLKEKVELLEFMNSDIGIIRLRIIMKYYEDIISGHSNRDHLSPLIKRMDSRIKDLDKLFEIREESADDTTNENSRNFTIISLKDVRMPTKKILPLLLCKKLYEEKKKEHDENKYLNIIIDEAHNILSSTSVRESEQWKDYRLETFEEIIKEGRKFGVFLTIASQRPYDISPTIISQLHTYFLHRLINENDIAAVEKTISYLDKVSFDYLPILPTGTCILAGLLAQVPVVVDVGKINSKYEPKSKTITLVDKWKN